MELPTCYLDEASRFQFLPEFVDELTNSED